MDYYFPQGLLELPTQEHANVELDSMWLETSQALASVEPHDQLKFISKLLEKHAISHCGIIIPGDFLDLSLTAMLKLSEAGRSNVVYNMVKAIGTKRPNSEDSRLPITRMPMGLLEYCVNFYNCSHLQQVLLM